MKKIFMLFWFSLIAAQEPITFSGESAEFVLDGVFPEVNLVFPVGGEVFYPDSSVVVSWTITEDSPEVDNALLELVNTDGDTVSQWTDISEESGIAVIMPDVLGDFSFQLTDTDTFGNSGNANSGVFTIVAVPVYGCTEPDACNFNPEANTDDGSCTYPEENFDCDGNCIVEIDCAEICGGDTEIDECGECSGNGADFVCWDEEIVCFESDCTPEPISFSGESPPFELDGIAPNIEWISPQNDEYYDSGETIIVNWSASDDSFSNTPIMIVLNSIGGDLLSEWIDVENTGSIDLTLPEINFTDAVFTISAMDNYGNTATDDADGGIHIGFVEPISFSGESNSFELDGIPPSVTLISPNGGEEYIVGETIQVSWTAEDESPNGEANIHLSTNSGANFELLESGLSFSGNAITILPDNLTDNAIIQIEVSDYYGNSSVDVSDNPFSILPIPDILFSGLSAQFKLDSVDPLVTWLSPNGGEILEANWPLPVTWLAGDDSFGDTPLEISWSAADIGISNELMAENVENTGTLNITMPNVSSAEVYFHIQATDEFGNSNSDDSDEANAIHHFGCTDPEADNFDPNAEVDNGICVFTYSLALHEGANLVSFPILPADSSIALVLGSLGTNITGAIGEGVGATQLPPGQWVGSLDYISRTSGYWLILLEDDVLTFTGTRTDPETVYELHEGANLVSWPFTASSEVEPALPDDIETAITGVIGEGTAASQIALGTWEGSLTSFESGKGYWLKTTMALDLVYEPPILGRAAVSGQFTDVNLSKIDIPLELDCKQSTRQAFYFIEAVEGIQIGDWIIAYNGNEVIGARQWKGEYTDIPAMGEDGSNYTKDYLSLGDVPDFKLLTAKNPKLTLLTGDIPAWSNNDLLMVSYLTEAVLLPEAISLESAYPNPFNPVTTMKYNLPKNQHVLLQVYDLQGRVVASLVDGLQDAGFHEIQWNADRHASGVYLVKMYSGDYSGMHKLILLK